MTKRKTPAGKQSGWSQSARFRAIGSAAIRAYNAQRPHLPKCGAQTRDGGACQNLGMKTNGRCRLHGGRVPKGDQWHRLTYPSGETPAAEDKFRRKVRDQERDARKREKRLAQMTPEERERHTRWQRTHKPGAAAKRAAARARAAQALNLEEMLSHSETPLSPEAAALQHSLDEARHQANELEILATDEGIFG